MTSATTSISCSRRHNLLYLQGVLELMLTNKPSLSVSDQISLLKSEDFLQTVNPQNTFASRLKQLLDKYSNVDIRAMGFPENWKEERLWND